MYKRQVRELKAENKQLQSRLPSMKEKLKESQELQELISENRDLRQQVAYLEDSLDSERNFSSRLLEAVSYTHLDVYKRQRQRLTVG